MNRANEQLKTVENRFKTSENTYRTCAQRENGARTHGKNAKENIKKTRTGISFENSVLSLLDPFAENHFKGDRSKATNYIVKRILKEFLDIR